MSLSDNDIARIKGATGNGCIPGCGGAGCGGNLGIALVLAPFFWIHENYGFSGLFVFIAVAIIIIIVIILSNYTQQKNNDENQTGNDNENNHES